MAPDDQPAGDARASESEALRRRIAAQQADLDKAQADLADARRDRSLLKNVLEGMTSGVAVYEACDDGADFIFKDVNQAVERIDHVRRADLIGRRIRQAFPGVEEFGLLDVLRRVWRTGKTEYLPQSRYVDERIEGWRENVVYRLPTGEVVAIYRDVTEGKQAEQELRRLAAAVTQAAESIIITDPQGRIQYVNPCFERMTGYAARDVIGKRPAVLKSGKHGEPFYRDVWTTISSGGTWRGRFTNRRKDGTLFEEDAVISPVFGAGREIVNYVAVKRDVTQEVSLEKQLRHSQKMEAIGRLAAGVAHDFTNKLSVIMNNATLAMQALDDRPRIREHLGEVVKAATQSSVLTGELLAFAHQTPLSVRRMDLNRVVSGAETLLRETMEGDYDVRLELSPSPLPVNVDPSQIEQCLVHLAVNAREAMPRGGRLTVETAQVVLSDEESVQLGQGLEGPPRGGALALLYVSDQGCGMSEDVQSRIFEPFYTTKGRGLSTGLGLSTAYGIVRQHGGQIRVYSSVGRGTTFTIGLPLAAAPAAEPAEPPGPVGEGRRLLLVEDNRLMRGVLARILQELGCAVLEAETGPEAVDLASAHGAVLDLLVADVALPAPDGRSVAAELRSRFPRLKVLFVSGYPRRHLEACGLLDPRDTLVTGPFSRPAVARALQDVLAQAG